MSLVTLLSWGVGIGGGVLASMALDLYALRRYGHPWLSVFITKCYYSDKWGWLTYNIWGDDSQFYEAVYRKLYHQED